MKEILILQNCRVGDIIQSTTMLRGLKEKYPGCRITMVVNTLFSEINFDKEILDEIIYFDQNKMFGVLSDESLSLVEKYNFTKEYVKKFTGRNYELLINLPSEDNGNTLASLLGPLAKEIRGALFTRDRTLVIRHPTIVMFYTIPNIREFNRFNIVDIHNLIGGVNPVTKELNFAITPEGEEFARAFYEDHKISADEFVVALQPGASEERKRWSANSFAKLATKLVNELKARVIICGAKSESPLGESIVRMAPRQVINAVGKTTLPGLAAILKRSSLLISNDTGTMHLAKAMGIRVIDLSTGPVHFRETGPYGEGDIIIQGDISCFPCNFDAVCNHLSCRDLISPEIVFKIVRAFKDDTPFSSLNPDDFRGVKIYTNYFNDIGRLETKPVFRYPITHFEILSFLLAHTVEVFYQLRKEPLAVSEIFQRIERDFDLSSGTELKAHCEQSLSYFKDLSGLLARATELLRQVLQATKHPTPGIPVQSMVDEVQKIYSQLYVLGCAYSQLRPFTLYLKLAIDSQDEGSLDQVAGDYLTQYDWISNQVDFMIASLADFNKAMDKNQIQPCATTG